MIKNIKKKYKNFKLSKKMLFVYVLIFGAFSVISIGTLQITLSIYEKELYKKSLQELNYFTKAIETELNNVEKTSFSIAMDYDIQKQLDYLTTIKDEKEYSFNMSSIRSRLLVESLTVDMLTNITFTDRKKTTVNLGKKHLNIPNEIYNEILDKAKEAKGGYVYIEPTLDFPYLVSGRDIREHIDYSLDYLGTIIFTSNIVEIIENNYGALESGVSDLYIFSNEGIIYRSNDILFDAIPKLDSENGYKIINIDKEKYFMCYLKSEQNDWMYVNLFPYSSIYYMNTIIRYIMVIGFIIIFIIVFFVMKKIANVITLPLERLTKSMRIVEKGEFEEAKIYLGNDDSMDEIGMLKKDFQIMLDRIMVLIHENYEKQIMLKDTEYKALQAQINPHFLYNTLNSINWMIKAKMNENASKMIMALGNLLHAAFSKELLIPINEEVELLKSYISIQKIRYDKRANFDITVEDGLEEYIVPRMILQPIVENSIIYGVENSLVFCNISVSVRQKQDFIIIEIADDGPGMEEEVLQKVRELKMEPKGNGIGLKNIIERCELLYNKDFYMEINSKFGEGTKIKIVIPKYRGENTV